MNRSRRDVAYPARTRPFLMLREFKDSSGKTWRVWDVYPSIRGPSSVAGPDDTLQLAAPFPNRALSDGWLCFESGSEKRRLTPVPPDWEICGAPALQRLCARAGYVSHSGSQDQKSEQRREV